jgi:hypothetical protein
MSSPADKSHEEREAEIAQKLLAVVREMEESVGSLAYLEPEVSLHPDGQLLSVALVDRYAEEEAKEKGDSNWDPLIEWDIFEVFDVAAGDLIQQAETWLRSERTREVLRQKQQAELEEAINYYLFCGEEPPPRSLRQRTTRAMVDDLPHEEEDNKDKEPPKMAKPRQGPPPPDRSLQNDFWASVWFGPPDQLEVQLREGRFKRVGKPRCFKLPESGSLAEVFAWIREIDEQHEPPGGVS